MVSETGWWAFSKGNFRLKIDILTPFKEEKFCCQNLKRSFINKHVNRKGIKSKPRPNLSDSRKSSSASKDELA